MKALLQQKFALGIIISVLAVLSCKPPSLPAANPRADDGVPDPGVTFTTIGSLSGVIKGPAYLASTNAGGLASTNAGGLVSNNTGSYRTQSLDWIPAQGALVYLTTPDERFYLGSDGKPLHTYTDSSGAYSFATAPAKAPVVVTVLFPQNRRLVGFMITGQGRSYLDVDPASLLVTEYLRDQARLSHTTMGAFAGLSAKLPNLIALTRAAIDSGGMPFSGNATSSLNPFDGSINALGSMRHAYVRGFAASNKPLSDAWKDLLGYRPLLIDELDVGLSEGMQLCSVTTSADTIYASAINHLTLQVTQTTSTATRSLFAVPRSAGVDYVGGMVASGSHLFLAGAGAGVFEVDSTAPSSQFLVDVEGNPASNVVNYNNYSAAVEGEPGDVSFGSYDVALGGGLVYTCSNGSNEVFRFGLDETGASTIFERICGQSAASRSAGIFFGGDSLRWGAETPLNSPTGVTTHEVGGQPFAYISDTFNHRIRRVSLGSAPFMCETVLGQGSEIYGNMLRPPGALEDGKTAGGSSPDIDDPMGVPASSCRLFSPHKVVFDAAGRMFVADSGHCRVRMMEGMKVYTLAGTAPGTPFSIGDSRRSGLGEISGLAFDAQGNLLIADARTHRLRRIRMPFGL